MQKYIETVGRRKTATARVRLSPSTKQSVQVNGKPIESFFTVAELSRNALLPLKHAEGSFDITVVVRGGGIAGQSDAIRHGIARALTEHEHALRGALKKAGYLKRDPRAKERKKPGLIKARKRGQWSKR